LFRQRNPHRAFDDISQDKVGVRILGDKDRVRLHDRSNLVREHDSSVLRSGGPVPDLDQFGDGASGGVQVRADERTQVAHRYGADARSADSPTGTASGVEKILRIPALVTRQFGTRSDFQAANSSFKT
jgi:hypothetical protein